MIYMTAKKNSTRRIMIGATQTLMVMMVIVVIVHLIFYMFHTTSLSDELYKSTTDYIALHNSAENLVNASDFLTEKAQRFTIVNDPEDLNAYFEELDGVRRREQSVEDISGASLDTMTVEQIKKAYEYSVSLSEKEIVAMKIVCDAIGYDAQNEKISAAALPAECSGMTADEKIKYAQKMLYDSSYYEQKTSIRNGVENCVSALIDDTRMMQSEFKNKLTAKLNGARAFVILQIVILIIMLVISIIINTRKNRLKKSIGAKKQEQ